MIKEASEEERKIKEEEELKQIAASEKELQKQNEIAKKEKILASLADEPPAGENV